ncbi:MAG: ATP synthase subunit I [Saprospirales bacterium]|nr:ATP synthase subunit I [Saprospirales bacterium]
MNEISYRIVAFVLGLVLGTIFFGGLWFTVKKSVVSKTPALWIFGSFIFRVGIIMLGFYFISSGSWQRLLISLAGFIVARFIVAHITRPKAALQMQNKREVSHEAQS